MKKKNSSYLVAALLVILSLALYSLQLLIFRSPRNTAFYLLQDFAFLPLQIAIVTVVLGSFLKNRAKTERLHKMDMLINAFFSEAGTEILVSLTQFNTNFADIRKNLDVQVNWNDRTFLKTARYLETADLPVECQASVLEELKRLLLSKRDFLIRMLENPNLLEHDTFTDMLLAAFHITEELMARDEFDEKNSADMAHLSVDVKRALRTLLIQWVNHMKHLSSEYPYLYSLEVRKNPFCDKKSVVIKT